MVERTYVITNEVLEPITSVLAHTTVSVIFTFITRSVKCRESNGVQQNHLAGSLFTYHLFASGAWGTYGREQNCAQNFGGGT